MSACLAVEWMTCFDSLIAFVHLMLHLIFVAIDLDANRGCGECGAMFA